MEGLVLAKDKVEGGRIQVMWGLRVGSTAPDKRSRVSKCQSLDYITITWKKLKKITIPQLPHRCFWFSVSGGNSRIHIFKNHSLLILSPRQILDSLREKVEMQWVGLGKESGGRGLRFREISLPCGGGWEKEQGQRQEEGLTLCTWDRYIYSQVILFIIKHSVPEIWSDLCRLSKEPVAKRKRNITEQMCFPTDDQEEVLRVFNLRGIWGVQK